MFSPHTHARKGNYVNIYQALNGNVSPMRGILSRCVRCARFNYVAILFVDEKNVPFHSVLDKACWARHPIHSWSRHTL